MTDALKSLDLTAKKRDDEQPPKPFTFEPRYESGKSICGMISILGAITVAVGFALAYSQVVSMAQSAVEVVEYIAIIPAIWLVIAGFMNTALGQIGKAIIDNTNANLERLALIKWQMKMQKP